MAFFGDIKIRIKLLIVFSLIIGIFIIGFAYIFFALRVINRSTGMIYNEGLIGVEKLIEADRDAYQSSIAISLCFMNIVDNDAESVGKNLDDADVNLKQVQERFSAFEEIYRAAKRVEHPAFAVFKENYTGADLGDGSGRSLAPVFGRLRQGLRLDARGDGRPDERYAGRHGKGL